MTQIIADLHLHSKYSRAVSPKMDLEHMTLWAQKKGIDLVGTGDFTHPLWIRELESKLIETVPGIYSLSQKSRIKFLLTAEISSIYSQGGKGRRIHTVFFAPSIAVVKKINQELIKKGANLMSDGRPIVGLSAKNLVELVWSVDERVLVIPAHIWTPWFSLLGSKSGFDSLKECFGEAADKIYGIETGLSCYDEETEVLTDNGWKKFDMVKYSDKICTLNIETSEVEYQKPVKIHSYRYKGKMYRLKTKRIDLLVTPNHNLLYSPCDFRKKPKFYLKKAEFLFKKSKRFKKDGIWIGKNDKYLILPAVQIKHGSKYYSGYRSKRERKFPLRSWLKFFGFWIAEGWTNSGKNGSYAVCLANQDKKMLLEMKKILESFDYNVFWDKKINNTLRVRDYQLFHYLKQFGKSSDKFIPQEIKSLSKELLEIFFEYYIKGDGHKYGRTNKGLSATTISPRLRDDLQEIALKMGISAYYKLGRRKGTPILSLPKAKLKDYKQSKDAWIIYFIRKNLHAVLPSTIKKHNCVETWIDFKGLVHCTTVPNRIIYIRRNGIPVWCGNSDPAMNWEIPELQEKSILSFSDAHSPAKLGREATVFINKKRADFSFTDLSKAIKRDKKSDWQIGYTIEFHPEEGKYHYSGHRTCGIVQSPQQTDKSGIICSVCGKPLTLGVMHRVRQLSPKTDLKIVKQKNSSGTMGVFPPKNINQPPYVMLVPLLEIIAQTLGVQPGSKKVLEQYDQLINSLGTEFDILLKTNLEKIAAINQKLAEGIKKARSGDIAISPGFDGVFGIVKIWRERNLEKLAKEQMSLF